MKYLISTLAVSTLLAISGCALCLGPSDVSNVERVRVEEVPQDIDPGPNPESNLGKLAIEFQTEIDPESLSAPGNINVSVKDSQGNRSRNIPGSVQYHPMTRTAYFIASDGIGFEPAAGDMLEYTIEVVGSGPNCVRRAGGACIDGCDLNSRPGGKVVERIKVRH